MQFEFMRLILRIMVRLHAAALVVAVHVGSAFDDCRADDNDTYIN